jgi:hypothetical protein
MLLRLCGSLAVAATMFAIAACTVPPAGEPRAGVPTEPSDDLSLAAQLYAGTPRTPAGFLADPPPQSFLQVTTYHLKTRHLDATAPTQHELCTDLWAQALAWSEVVAAQASSYLDLVGNIETERYYEFDRVPHGDPQRYERMRVFRCGYVDRGGVDLDTPGDFAGTLNVRPLDAAALGGLAEYLWEFSEYDNVDHAVVSSAAGAVTTGLAHTLTLASLERGSTCDRVSLSEWTTTADPATGELRSTVTPLREFSVHRVGDTVVGC